MVQCMMPIAVVGLSGIFPEARNIKEYWSNILAKKDCIRDIPDTHWNPEDFYDEDPLAQDKTYCKRGGFLPSIEFNPMEFGIPPANLEVTDVSQLFSLLTAKRALEDAGYFGENARDFNNETTGVILGFGGFGNTSVPLSSRLYAPQWKKLLLQNGINDEEADGLIGKFKNLVIDWQENSFPGLLGNVAAGRICNRLNLGGTNCTVDAACASSLSALKMALFELNEGHCDMVLTGGVDTNNSIFSYMCFSKTPALSRSGEARPFDHKADGILIGEGIGILVLKRLEDAERDGDRIYSVIKGIGSASDGRCKSIYAPRKEGQILAMERAYERSGISPQTVSLIEAHGTGTIVGDLTEYTALRHVFTEANACNQSVALGSVKSQIGHTKIAAGSASLMKVCLALHHKILPATIKVDLPNPKFDINHSPFYINTENRPWFQQEPSVPRRAGVSAFGFGGTNFHVVLEEHDSKFIDASQSRDVADIVIIHAENNDALVEKCRNLLDELRSENAVSLYREFIFNHRAGKNHPPVECPRVGMVIQGLPECIKQFDLFLKINLSSHQDFYDHTYRVFYRKQGMGIKDNVVALFPGQGSQYVGMACEMAMHYAPMRDSLERCNRVRNQSIRSHITDLIYPPAAFQSDEQQENENNLMNTVNAQPAIGSVSAGLFRMLQKIGFQPHFAAGHSFGELTALWAAEVIDDDAYYELAVARGAAMECVDNDSDRKLGAMIAVAESSDMIQAYLKDDPQLSIANFNAPKQTVIAGPEDSIDRFAEKLKHIQVTYRKLPVSAAFHTPLVEHAFAPFAEACKRQKFSSPKLRVFSNSLASEYPTDPSAIQELLTHQILKPVRFKEQIEEIYSNGGRIFVEIGPNKIQSNLVSAILQDKPHVVVTCNPNKNTGDENQYFNAVTQLHVIGVPLQEFKSDERTSNDADTKKMGSIEINGSLYLSPKTREKQEAAMQPCKQILDNKNILRKSNHSSNEETPAMNKKPNKNEQVNTNTKSMVDQTYYTTKNHDTRQSFTPSAANTDGLLNNQQLNSQVQMQYLECQSKYMNLFEKMMTQSKALFDQHSEHPSFEKGLDLIQQQLAMLQNNQQSLLSVQQQYLSSQTGFIQPGAVSENVEFNLSPSIALAFEERKNLEANQSLNSVPDVSAPIEQDQPIASPPNVIEDEFSTKIKDLIAGIVIYPVNLMHDELHLHHDLGMDLQKRLELRSKLNSNLVELTDDHIKALQQASTLGEFILQLKAQRSSETNQDQSLQVAIEDTVQPSPLDANQIVEKLISIVSDKTGYPAEMLDMEMDLEADLGIDSIKRVEILMEMQEEFPDIQTNEEDELGDFRTLKSIADSIRNEQITHAPFLRSIEPETTTNENPQEQTLQSIDANKIQQQLIDIISDKTGYPAEMLELDMDLEADLGIDSIKRVEILMEMQEAFPDLPQSEEDEMGDYNTLRQIVESIEKAYCNTAIEPQQEEKVFF